MACPESMRELIQLVREDLVAHRGEWSRPGFHAVATLRYNQYVHTLPRSWPRKLLVGLGRFAETFCRNVENLELPYTVQLGRRVVFEHQSIVVHGDAVIGDDCVVRQGCTLGSRYPEYPREAPTLGKGVNLGSGATVLGSVQIGNGASIGANAVVLNDVTQGATIVGVPGRERKHRRVAANPSKSTQGS
jgi:serine O-acetyltransferase